jgi:spoIIIJ-associated protein
MEAFEFEGKTTEDAIDNACHQLNLPRDEMDIEIMEPGSAGVFGIVGGRKAKIKVTISNEMPELADEQDALAIAKETLEDILALIPVEHAAVSVEQAEGTITLNIDGDKSGLLIGRKGRTLDALQFIVNRIANKSLEKRVQIVIDSENYRQRRQDFLIQMALRIGDKARKAGKPMATNLLNPHDRRIVHLALKDDENLDTKSRGEGVLKKVLIIPRKNSSSKPFRE